MIACGSEKKKL